MAQRTAGLERHDGYVPFYLDAARNRVLVEVPKLNDDMLYFVQVAKGIGNVDLGIDRGAGGASKVVYFERQGNRALIAHLRQAERDITKYLENPTAYAPKSFALPQPPGAPIGER